MAPHPSRSLQVADAILTVLDASGATNTELLAALEIARIVVDAARPKSPMTALDMFATAPAATART